MTVEEQLRAAGRAVREQVRDLPGLDLPTEPAARRARARTLLRWPGAGRWLIPMATAAAVVALAVTLVAVKNPPPATHQAGAGRAASLSTGSAASLSTRSVPASAVDPEALPRYFVAIDGLSIMGEISHGQMAPVKADSVVVGETLTGKRLATIYPQDGNTFVGVTGAADDRTFVLDSVQIAVGQGFLSATQQRTWYLLRIGPGATLVQKPTPLHLFVPSGADINGVALSPDGTKLAVFYQMPGRGDTFPYSGPNSGPFTLGIYSVATGAVLRSWTGTDPYHGSYGYGSDGLPDPNGNLTWTSDGQRLAFAYRSSRGPSASLYLREVNLSGPGGDLFTDSSVIATIAVSTTTGRSKIWCESLGITGDGRSAVCGADLPKTPPVGATLDALTEPGPWVGCAAPTDTVYPGLARISLTGDRLAQVLYEARPKCMGGGFATVLWSSPSGDTVLGTIGYTDDPSMTEHRAMVLYRHGTVTTINWPGAASLLLANETAF